MGMHVGPWDGDACGAMECALRNANVFRDERMERIHRQTKLHSRTSNIIC